MPPRSKINAQRSSGNVFADLQIRHADEALVKSALALHIARTIDKDGLTQAAAAKRLSVDQPKVSALLRGRLTGFSAERLFRLLNALGQDIEIAITPSRRKLIGVTRVVP